MEAGNHPDFHVITRDLIRYHDKTGKSKGIDLSINVIRPELLEPASRKAVMGRGKVFLVEQAELMNPAAQNALLKTLEEPAGRTLIILLTDQPGCCCRRSAAGARRSGSRRSMSNWSRASCASVRFDPETAAARRPFHPRLARPGAALDRRRRHRPRDRISYHRSTALFAGQSPADLPAWFKKAADAYAEKQLARDPLGSKDAATREGLRALSQPRRRARPAATVRMEDADDLNRACAAIDAIVRAETYLDGNVNVSLVFQQLAAALGRASAA